MKYTWLLLCLLAFHANAQKETIRGRIHDFEETNVKDFIMLMLDYQKDSLSTHQISVLETAPVGWVKQEDIPYLVTLIQSKQNAKCIISLLSSQMPMRNDHSELGGIAMDLIDAYRNKTVYPPQLFLCTAADDQRAKEIETWWRKQQK